jgi:hypothetical protein
MTWPARRRQNENRQASVAEVLLVPKVLVGRDQRVKGCFCDLEQSIILQCGPTHLKRSGDRVTGEGSAQRDRGSLVEEHPRVAAPIRLSRSRDGKAALGMLQHGLDLFTGHARKPSEKVTNSRPALEILEKRLHRHACTLEQPDAAPAKLTT